MEWHYFDVFGVQHGPVDEHRLKVLFKNNIIDGKAYVWREGMESWTMITAVPELKSTISTLTAPAPPQRRPTMPPPLPTAEKKIAQKSPPVQEDFEASFIKYLHDKGFPLNVHELVQDKIDMPTKHKLMNSASSMPTPLLQQNAMLEGPIMYDKKHRHASLVPGSLRFYKEYSSGSKKLEHIKLDNSTSFEEVEVDDKVSIQHSWAIKIHYHDGKKHKTTTLHAPTKELREVWLDHFKIAKWGALPEDKSISQGHVLCEMTYDMMMGIRTTVGRQAGSNVNSIASEEDFANITSISFPSKGSKGTPPHKMRDFGFKDYCPSIFRRIRRHFGIDPASYLMDVCGNFNYLEFVSNSKSGEFFFHSHDRKYMIKTVSHMECRCLFHNMRHYYRHLMSNPNTVINKFFGLHKVKPAGRPFYFLIMGSIFPPTLKIHRLFDLKGSTRNRSVKKSQRNKVGTCYKDNDFVEQRMKIVVDDGMMAKLKTQLKKDVALLEEMRIIDYSVLLGMHYVDGFDPATLIAKKGSHQASEKSPNTSMTNDAPPLPDLSQHALLEWKDNLAKLLKEDGATLLAGIEAMTVEDLELVSLEDFNSLTNDNPLACFLHQSIPSQVARARTMTFRPVDSDFEAHFPQHAMPAQVDGDAKMRSEFVRDQGGFRGHDQDGHDVIFFVGIIDTLIEYGLKKQMEHKYKAKVKNLDPKTFSVVEPPMYAQRMLEFLDDKIITTK